LLARPLILGSHAKASRTSSLLQIGAIPSNTISVGDNVLARPVILRSHAKASRTSSLLQTGAILFGHSKKQGAHRRMLERGLPAKLTTRSVRQIRVAASRASLAPTDDANPSNTLSVGDNLLARSVILRSHAKASRTSSLQQIGASPSNTIHVPSHHCPAIDGIRRALKDAHSPARP
jgi:hypothetical protein